MVFFTFSCFLLSLCNGLAFPTAIGAGAQATGGRGGTVCIVNTLEYNAPLVVDDTTGSVSGGLGTIFEADLGTPKQIIFTVSGVIEVPDYATPRCTGSVKGSWTVNGQTAPGPVVISTDYMTISECSNIIFRYVSFVSRGTHNADALWLNTGEGTSMTNVVMDHVSAYYGGDECLSITGRGLISGVTVQWALMGSASKGSILGSSVGPSNVTMAYSAFVDANYRFPNLLSDSSDSYQDAINIFVENYGGRLIRLTGGGNFLVQNMYMQPNRADYGIHQLQWRDDNRAKVHSSGNIIVGKKDVPTTPDFDLWEIFAASDLPENDPLPEDAKVNEPRQVNGVPFEVMPATEVPTRVLPFVGNNVHLADDGSIVEEPYELDTFFLDLAMHQVQTVDARRNPDPKYPAVPTRTTPDSADADKDGMPDVWELATFGTLDRDGKGDADSDGYTDLEEYLWLVDGGAGEPAGSASATAGGDGGSTTSAGTQAPGVSPSASPPSSSAPSSTTASGQASSSSTNSTTSDGTPLIVAIIAIAFVCLVMAGLASFFYARSKRDREIALAATRGGRHSRAHSRRASAQYH